VDVNPLMTCNHEHVHITHGTEHETMQAGVQDSSCCMCHKDQRCLKSRCYCILASAWSLLALQKQLARIGHS
jgi:hypothetical protein